ncbi:hypothetical protein BDF14DRAFT_1774198 [Spinellus fusiger]|nr:hypothetical protein BDF14DRAFT_1774198 [Spinellus fusiger]
MKFRYTSLSLIALFALSASASPLSDDASFNEISQLDHDFTMNNVDSFNYDNEYNDPPSLEDYFDNPGQLEHSFNSDNEYNDPPSLKDYFDNPEQLENSFTQHEPVANDSNALPTYQDTKLSVSAITSENDDGVAFSFEDKDPIQLDGTSFKKTMLPVAKSGSSESPIKGIVAELKNIQYNLKAGIKGDMKTDMKNAMPDMKNAMPDMKKVVPDMKKVIPDMKNAMPDMKKVMPDMKNVVTNIDTMISKPSISEQKLVDIKNKTAPTTTKASEASGTFFKINAHLPTAIEAPAFDFKREALILRVIQDLITLVPDLIHPFGPPKQNNEHFPLDVKQSIIDFENSLHHAAITLQELITTIHDIRELINASSHDSVKLMAEHPELFINEFETAIEASKENNTNVATSETLFNLNVYDSQGKTVNRGITGFIIQMMVRRHLMHSLRSFARHVRRKIAIHIRMELMMKNMLDTTIKSTENMGRFFDSLSKTKTGTYILAPRNSRLNPSQYLIILLGHEPRALNFLYDPTASNAAITLKAIDNTLS